MDSSKNIITFFLTLVEWVDVCSENKDLKKKTEIKQSRWDLAE